MFFIAPFFYYTKKLKIYPNIKKCDIIIAVDFLLNKIRGELNEE